MRVLFVPVVIVLLVGCGGEEGAGLKKKVDQLERRVEALERGGRRGAGRKEGKNQQAAVVEGPKGRVEVSGDATRVALLKDGNRFEIPGEVPVGSYQIIARFGDEKVEAGSLEVADGETVSVACTAASKTCTRS
jgi:hypothetical protein